MGYAIAEAARNAGHHITLISGPVAIAAPAGVVVRRVVSAAEMLAETRRAFRTADAAIFAAAVSDYRPKNRASKKGPKSKRGTTIRLEPTEDIAATIGKLKGDRVTIGFALEDHAGRLHAERKMRTKRFDAIILNSPRAIDAGRTAVEYYDGSRWDPWPALPKSKIANRIIGRVMEIRDS